MSLTQQVNQLVHAVAEGSRDEAEPVGLGLDEFRVDTGAFDCLLEVVLGSAHSEVENTDALDRAFDQLGVVLPDRVLMNLGNDFDLIIKDCCADEVRYTLKAELLPPFLEIFLLHAGETNIVKISSSWVIIIVHKCENLKGDYL